MSEEFENIGMRRRPVIKPGEAVIVSGDWTAKEIIAAGALDTINQRIEEPALPFIPVSALHYIYDDLRENEMIATGVHKQAGRRWGMIRETRGLQTHELPHRALNWDFIEKALMVAKPGELILFARTSAVGDSLAEAADQLHMLALDSGAAVVAINDFERQPLPGNVRNLTWFRQSPLHVSREGQLYEGNRLIFTTAARMMEAA
ncbi:hypothetical protein SAMN05877838_3795 [Hoeflea halophila]|uniref:Uncharacterized protein n=2 Tax=Hoeflea halophila TaxID=714899 RepID=A0A286IFL6_9HYPH|nr:hypothetical protein SAMN05877838_3795 [Hoeflea halophila]